MFLMQNSVSHRLKPSGNRIAFVSSLTSGAACVFSAGMKLFAAGAAMTDQVKKLVEWDGKIPLWSILMMGLSFALYTWNEIRGLNDRLLVRETSSITYRTKVDDIEKKMQDFSTMRGDITTLKELLIRIERKLDGPK
jgi:hypothetical protein